jgi:hypothetical protein
MSNPGEFQRAAASRVVDPPHFDSDPVRPTPHVGLEYVRGDDVAYGAGAVVGHVAFNMVSRPPTTSTTLSILASSNALWRPVRTYLSSLANGLPRVSSEHGVGGLGDGLGAVHAHPMSEHPEDGEPVHGQVGLLTCLVCLCSLLPELQQLIESLLSVELTLVE